MTNANPNLSAEEKDPVQETGADTNPVEAKLAAALGKQPPHGNPLMGHKFGADPYALVHDDRVYLYMTGDVLEHDGAGEIKENSYSSINKLHLISSSDLMNWTDHGAIAVAGPQGAATWATQSWAPAAAHKVIDGQDRFFLYFANNATSIGVLTSDSPEGPWVDPIGKPLITRQTPGVEAVTWLFDPAVLVDDDGEAYIYFGGGVPEGQFAEPNTARVMRLGPDMTSVVGTAEVIPAPYMFENSGINKVNGQYYYTYCSNFYDGVRAEGSPRAGEIIYMTSDNPMGPWTYQGSILKNPMHFFGVGGNNHHAIFEFRDNWYIAYHAQTLSKAMGVAKGYRSTHLNPVEFDAASGLIQEITASYEGVPQLQSFDPYAPTRGVTMAWNAGITTAAAAEPARTHVADIQAGDWVAQASVDFGEGAATFRAWLAGAGAGGTIELRLGGAEGESIGALEVPALAAGETVELTAELSGASGTHDLYLVFQGAPEAELFRLAAWQFER